MANRIILTDVDNTNLVQSTNVPKAVPFVISTDSSVNQLAMSKDGTVTNVTRIPLGEFPDTAVVTKPVIIYPSEGSTINPIIKVDTKPWSHLYRRGQKLMRTMVATDAAFSNVVIDVTESGEVSTHDITLYQLNGLTKYWVKVYKEEVCPYDDVPGEGQWSSVVSFTTLQDPYIFKPTVSVVYDSFGTVYHYPTFTSSVFQYWGVEEQTHVSSIWTLKNLSTGQSEVRTTQGTTITWDTVLPYDTPYSITVQHTGNTLRPSAVSATVEFRTEVTPFTNTPTITYPSAGNTAPYYAVSTAAMTVHNRTADPVAARYRLFVNSVLKHDIVIHLSTYDPASISWSVSGITTTRSVSAVADLYAVAIGVMDLGSSMGLPYKVEAYHVDRTWGVSKAVSLGAQTASTVTTTIDYTTTGGITAPISGNNAVDLTPTITNNVTAREFTVPGYGTWKDTFAVNYFVSSTATTPWTVAWSSTNVGTSATSSRLIEKTAYAADLYVQSTTQPTATPYLQSRVLFSTFDMTMDVNGTGITSPVTNSTGNSLATAVTVPISASTATLRNTEDYPDMVISITFQLSLANDFSSIYREKTYLASAALNNGLYKWADSTAEMLPQNTQFYARAIYKTNYPQYVPDQTTSVVTFRTAAVSFSDPTLVVSNMSTREAYDTSNVTVTLNGITAASALRYPTQDYAVNYTITASSDVNGANVIGSVSGVAQNQTGTVSLSTRSLGVGNSTTAYIRVTLSYSQPQYIATNNSVYTQITTPSGGITTSVTSPTTGGTVRADPIAITISQTKSQSRVWKNLTNLYQSDDSRVGIGLLPVSIGFEYQISAVSDFSTVIYTGSMIAYETALNASEDYLYATSTGALSGTVPIIYATPGTWPSNQSAGYVRGTYTDSTNDTRTISDATLLQASQITTDTTHAATGYVPVNTLVDGTYFIRTREVTRYYNSDRSSVILTQTSEWDTGGTVFTFISTRANLWGGVSSLPPKQGTYGHAFVAIGGSSSYGIGGTFVTDIVSNKKIVRNSGRWAMSFSPTRGGSYIGAVSTVNAIHGQFGVLENAGLIIGIDTYSREMLVITTLFRIVYPVGDGTYVGNGNIYVPVPSYGSGMLRTNIDYWWYVVDLDHGHVELYYPDGVPCMNFKIPKWVPGMDMVMVVGGADGYGIWYDSVRTAPSPFSTIATDFFTYPSNYVQLDPSQIAASYQGFHGWYTLI